MQDSGHLHPDACTNADTAGTMQDSGHLHPNTHADSDRYTHTHTNLDRYTYTHANLDCYTHADFDPFANADTACAMQDSEQLHPDTHANFGLAIVCGGGDIQPVPLEDSDRTEVGEYVSRPGLPLG